MSIASWVGFTAAFLTTVAFLPQVIKVWRTRSTGDISLVTFSTLCVGITMWMIYGLIIGDMPLIAANAVTLALASTILYFKIRYK